MEYDLILVVTDLYEVTTDFNASKILITLPDGGKALIRHKNLVVLFKHRRTKDSMTFLLTGRDKFYQDGKDIGEIDTLAEFRRLLGHETGTNAFKLARLRMYLS